MNTLGRRTGAKDITNEDRNKIAQWLLMNRSIGVLERGKIKEAVALHGISRSVVARIWRETKRCILEGTPVYLTARKHNNTRQKQHEITIEHVVSIPVNERSTIRKLATSLSDKSDVKVSKSSIGRWVKSEKLRAYSNAIKPHLTSANMLLRLKFSLGALEFLPTLSCIKFKSMHNVIHIDEKWFYITSTTQRYYLTSDEQDPHRTCKSKRFITKVMFMCAVGRPIYDSNGELIFDGKVGMFPFTYKEPARRASKNRPKGTMELKPIESITKEVIKDCLIHQILPAIKEKWPANASKHIIIQQDNAKPHINNNDPEFRAAATSNGFNIQLICQPSNSPDTNVNDLGWFRAIESLQTESASYNVSQLVDAVADAFTMLEAQTLNNVFLSLQCTLVEIMKVRGSNAFKLPHMGKNKLLGEGGLPLNLEVDESLVRECIQYLVDVGEATEDIYGERGVMTSIGY